MKYLDGFSNLTELRLRRLLNVESAIGGGRHASAGNAGEVAAVDCGGGAGVLGFDAGNPSFLTTFRFRPLLEPAADTLDCIRIAGIS
mmetsp:Transcript_94342/g.177551  ORF Transcript_94342/g.177551 Transcript_94342/m.177551 type:complete len:87 (-) Transcript_94342:469-729(-)